MSKIDQIKSALADLRELAGRTTAHISSVDDTSQLDEVLGMVKDITMQLRGALPPEEAAEANTGVNEARTAAD